MKRPEQALQIAVARFLSLALKPPVWWSSLDHGAGKMTPASAGLRKARGVKAGLPDVLIIAPGPDGYMGVETPLVIGIELKAKGGRQSLAQEAVALAWVRLGASYYICKSLEEVFHVCAVLHSLPLHARLS